MSSTLTFTVQFALDHQFENTQDMLMPFIIKRVCEKNPILGKPGQSIFYSGNEQGMSKLEVKVLYESFQNGVIQKEELYKSLAACSLFYGDIETISGWIHYPPDISYSEDPDGDFFSFSELTSFIGKFKENPVDMIDDVTFKFYIKGLSENEFNPYEYNKLIKVAALGSQNEREIIKNYLSTTSGFNNKVSIDDFNKVLNHGESQVETYEFGELLCAGTRFVDLSCFEGHLEVTFRAALDQYIDSLDREAIQVLSAILNDTSFVDKQRREIEAGFTQLSLSHLIDLYFPDAGSWSHAVTASYDHLIDLERQFCQELSPFS